MQQTEILHLATWLWLANALGFAAHSGEILAQYETPQQLIKDRFCVELSNLFSPAQLQALQQKEPEDFISRIEKCKSNHVHMVCYDDPQYPALLRTISSPPPVLFYRGNLAVANENLTVAMVGTRRPSAYGIEATKFIANGLARAGVVLVSGMATGLDSECHKAAINAGTPTIACIAFGHDECYPASNRSLKAIIEKQGLVLSEYPPGTKTQKSFFLHRNRLIAALSHGVCVAEARKSSGTMNTVGAALEYGRDVFSVPGNIFSPLCEGTNGLLREGAIPAICAQDILTWYHLEEDVPVQCDSASAKTEAEPLLSAGAQKVKAALRYQAQSLAALCEATQLAPAKMMAALTELELAGISSQQAGRQFVLK